MTDLQQFLSSLVRASGVQQKEIAHRTGLSEKHISQMLTGKVEGTLDAWQALLDAVGVQLSIRD